MQKNVAQNFRNFNFSAQIKAEDRDWANSSLRREIHNHVLRWKLFAVFNNILIFFLLFHCCRETERQLSIPSILVASACIQFNPRSQVLKIKFLMLFDFLLMIRRVVVLVFVCSAEVYSGTLSRRASRAVIKIIFLRSERSIFLIIF